MSVCRGLGRSLCSAAMLLMVACAGGEVEGTDGGGASFDAGPSRDAGVRDDAGERADAGASTDAGTHTDADGGVSVDAGSGAVPSDAGETLDAGSSNDGGASADAGAAGDAGQSLIDAGAPGDAGVADAGTSCQAATCELGSQCCMTRSDTDWSGTCASTCGTAAVSLPCDSLAQCGSGKVCCATLEFGALMGSFCAVVGITSACQSSCGATRLDACPGTQTTRLCRSDADCVGASMGYTSCRPSTVGSFGVCLP